MSSRVKNQVRKNVQFVIPDANDNGTIHKITRVQHGAIILSRTIEEMNFQQVRMPVSWAKEYFESGKWVEIKMK